jgi:hypothetical protein
VPHASPSSVPDAPPNEISTSPPALRRFVICVPQWVSLAMGVSPFHVGSHPLPAMMNASV